MRKRVLIANVLVALGFAIAPHLAPVKAQLDVSEPSVGFAWLITVGSILYLCTSTALLWIAEAEKGALVEMRTKLDQYFRAPAIKPLRDDEFYDDFLAAVRNAESYVRISYFGPNRPDASRRPERDRYYSDLQLAVVQKPRVLFRRLMRNTASNRAWMCEQFSAWTDMPNMSAALLPDFPRDQDMAHALAVQIVDTEQAWLVAVEGHERLGQYRDLHLRDTVVAEFLAKYFDRLWRNAIVVLDHGELTESGLELEVDCGDEQ